MSEIPPKDKLIDEAANAVRQVRIAFAAEHGIDLANDEAFNGPGDPNGIKREVAAALTVFEGAKDARIAELEGALRVARERLRLGGTDDPLAYEAMIALGERIDKLLSKGE